MFKIPFDIKKGEKLFIAVSGGIDSMVVLDFFKNAKRCDVTVLHFDHGTSFGAEARIFVENFCKNADIPCITGQISADQDFAGKSKEDVWRKARYAFFESVTTESDKILLGHHLNDAIESWIFSSMHGNPMLIPSTRGRYYRPFILSEKEKIISWAERKGLVWTDDPSNCSDDYMRNYIRNNLMPHALHVNPGLPKVIKKKYLAQIKP